ncbi:RyR domain-containing protein [Sphingobium sp. AN641]|uniref:RyR domain-containing protein n=1 Tax=Sphingobium sp. AN641 TaxID=3133443 RepID=UPI0030BB8AF1
MPQVAPVIRFGAMAVALLLGMWGFAIAYAPIGGAERTLADNGFSAMRLIVGHFPAELEGRDMPPALQIARWALPLLTFWTTVVLAWEQLRNPMRLYFMRARGDHLVIAGDPGGQGGLAARTAMAELNNGRHVLLWPQDRRALWVNDAVEQGAAEVECSGDQRGLDLLALDKARAVLLLGQDAPANIALATSVGAKAAGVRPAGDPLDIILRIDDLDLRRSVESRFEHGDRKTARVRLASVPDIVARQLSLDRPLDMFKREGVSGRTILVIGFTPPIERFILRTLAGGHYRDGGKPAFIVHDADAAGIEQGFRARHPAADRLAPVRFVAGRTDPAFIPALVDAAPCPVAILIDQPDDARAMAIALAVDSHYRVADRPAPPIHVQLDGGYDHRMGAGIFPFGGLDALADPEYLLQDRHDALARSVHDFYLEGRFADGERIGARASMREWEDLPESFRDDNRLVADCYQLKLRDIGARLVPGTGATLALTDGELEELARAEHDRWIAAKLVQGWEYGAERDDLAKRHPDIVPYDELSEAIKDLDREQVRIMARLLGATGQRALRTLTIAIAPGIDGLEAALPVLVAELTVHYPDRVVIFAGDLADPPGRAAMLAMHEEGRLVQVGLACHAMPLIDSLSGIEQGQTAALLNHADRIWAAQNGAALSAMLAANADMSVSADSSGTVQIGSDGTILRAPWRR